MTILLDIAPSVSGGTVGIAAGAVFMLIFAALAFIAFKLLKRTVRMAVRVAVVAIMLAIGVTGSVAAWAIRSGSDGKSRTTYIK